MQRSKGVRARQSVPKVGGENIQEARRRKNRRRQFLLALDIVLRKIGIAGNTVVNQVGDIPPVKTFIVPESGEAGGGKNPDEDSDERN